MFIPQMANHAAPWEDENGWTHSNCPVGYRFPEMLCKLSRYLGHPQCPEYISKVVLENEAQMSDVPAGAPVMAGTFLANGHPVVILFDSGASHSFISALCVFRNNLECG